MSQSLDEILKTINTSLVSTNEAVSNLGENYDTPELPELVQDLLDKTNQTLPEGVSLLDLKNNAMISYINNLALIILARIEAVKTNHSEEVSKLKEAGVKGSIVQRVVMERGIKNLEKKLSYQLEKMVRNYRKMEKDSSEQTVTKKLEEAEKDDEDDSEDDDSEDEDSEDELNFRPDTSSLVKDLKKSSSGASKPSTDTTSEKPSTEKYRPPKIAATLPPTDFREKSNKSGKNGTKLQAMEEYLAETGDAPMSEQSIGSNIINNGRGGVQTLKERRKEEEIKRYEESNFTRLSTNMSKKDKQNKRKQDSDTFFGEDWGIFNNRRTDMNTGRSSKPKSAWERAKKRRTQ